MKRKIEDRLVEWKNQTSGRKPLLMHGARQVGKTYILNAFGEKYYEHVVYINLELNREAASVFDEDISPARIIRLLEAITGEEVAAGRSLLILDEIQVCERALTSLKYFCEEAPEYHIAAAGSLLGVAINRERFSFPVGKVQSIYLYPLDFEEFLWANDEIRLCEEICLAAEACRPLPEALHKRALELYHYYLIVGGMPAAVNEFLSSGKLVFIPEVQRQILGHYSADMTKYTDDETALKVRACFGSIPAQLAKENRKFMYKVVRRGGSSAMFGVSIEWLTQAGVVLKCQKIEHGFEPVSVYADLSSFKLYMADVGLLIAMSGLSQQTVLFGEANTFMGAVTENYLAEQLVAQGFDLYYWAPDGSEAELDFVTTGGGARNEIIAIECKRGTASRSRSLGMFIRKYAPAKAVRFSEENFYRTNNVSAIPLYAAFCLDLAVQAQGDHLSH